MRSLFLFGFAWLGLASVAVAQPGSLNPYDSARAAQAKAWADSVLAAQAPQNNAVTWTAAPVIWYSPETRFAFGAVGVYFFRPGQNENKPNGIRPGLSPSRVSALFLYSLNKQVLANTEGQFYADADRWRLAWELGWFRYPFSFFGIGDDTREEDEERYQHTYPLLDATVLRGLAPHIFAGLGIVAEHNRFSDFAEGGLLEVGNVPGQNGGWNLGFGPRFLFDSRDNVLYPYRGIYAAANATFFSGAWGAAQSYTDVVLDVRGFIPVGKTHVIALQGYAHAVPGEAPFHRLALLGGPDLLRGYFRGRYRDRHLLAAQAAWRFPIWRFLRGTAFVGAGNVADELDAFDLATLKLAGGLGLRLVLNAEDRSMLRFDAAVTRDGDPGFYVQFVEAF